MSDNAASPAPSEVTNPAPTELSADAVFDALADEYRRHALAYLTRTDGAVTVDELVAHVAAAVGASADPADRRSRVAVTFHHVHLPKMAHAGLVAYDRDRGTVAITDAAAAVDFAACFDAI